MSNEIIQPNRRQFLKTTAAAGAAVVAGVARPGYAAGDETLQVALIGCGGRGSGAAINALSVKRGPMKLVAMADVFPDKLNGSYENISRRFTAQVDVPAERRFLGFDGYKKAMDCLKPGDIAIFATPPAFRWVHFTYAIEKGLNVFMEKPVTVDGPTSKRMFELGTKATAKNLKVGVGLMSRHNRGLQELAKRVHNGDIGDIILMRGYRMHGPGGSFQSTAKPKDISEIHYQLRRFHSFIWASGGNFSDFYIHIIDHLGWMKNSWPVRAQGLGGRHYKWDPKGLPYVDQNFDTYSVEYTFADGSKFFFDGRCMTGCKDIYSSYMHGTKAYAVASRNGDCGLPSAIYKTQNPSRADIIWESVRQDDPYQNEWNDLVDAIRDNKPYNEVKYGVECSLATSMGRMAAHTGQEITWEDMLNCEHEMAPNIDKQTDDGPAPLTSDAEGRYPVPQPGRVTKREY